MRVKAKELGYYGLLRRKPGEIFNLEEVKGFHMGKDGKKSPKVYSAESQFSDKWMEKIDSPEVTGKRGRERASADSGSN